MAFVEDFCSEYVLVTRDQNIIYWELVLSIRNQTRVVFLLFKKRENITPI